MYDFLVRVEGLSFSTWVRESGSIWAFPMLLFLHTLGMSVVAGGAAIIDFAVLGLWPRTAPIRPLERFYPLLWFGFWMNTITGISIFMKDASVYARNPDFFIKLFFVFAGVALLAVMRRRIFRDPQLDIAPVSRGTKTLAFVSLLMWFAAIVTGRLIAYVGPVPGL
jgi:hypothetical protein